MASVMVLSAGFGTRLGPLTELLPKPLVPVGNAPLLEHTLRTLKAQGFGAAVINTHHLPRAFDGLAVEGLTLHYSHESEILGGAGGVRRALPLLEPPLVVYNGDIWTHPPLAALRAALGRHAACLLVAPASGAGTVGLGATGNVVRLRGEQHGEEQRAADWIGVMALSEAALNILPERGCLIGDVCLPLLRRGESIGTLWSHEPWFDVGSLRGYLLANLHWLEQQSLSNHVGAGVELPQGVSLGQCVLGEGARVSGRGALERCVVWPRASVRAPLRESIVISDGRVVSAG